MRSLNGAEFMSDNVSSISHPLPPAITNCGRAEVLTRTSARPQLVIAGGKGWLIDETLSLINSAPLRDRILLTGYLNDEDLRAVYSSCRAFVYSSLYEGFG